MLIKRIYISGQITGLSKRRWYKNFEKVERRLLAAGYDVINPAKNMMNLTYDEYMAIDLMLLERCDAIYMLDNWRTSKGARKELTRARELNLEVLYENPYDKERERDEEVLKCIKIGVAESVVNAQQAANLMNLLHAHLIVNTYLQMANGANNQVERVIFS